MKEKTISTKLKGTVLYTVVSVLMVLIVFLMGTLALAATANNRAMNNYNSAQTQFTAKTAVEAVMAAMQNNMEVATAAANVDKEHPVLTVDGITFDDASLGRVESATIEYYGTKWVLEDDVDSEDYNKMVEKTVIKISATAVQGRESSTVAAYVLRDAGPSSPTDGNNNGFVSTGGASTDNHVCAFGGTYLGFDMAYAGSEIKLSDEVFQFKNGEVIETDMQINGDMKITSGAMTLVMKQPGTGLTVWGDMILEHDLYVTSVNATTDEFTTSDKQPYTKLPFIYVENELLLKEDDMTIGASDIPLNIYCGNIGVEGNGVKDVYADIYCYDADATSTLGSGSTYTKLHQWVANIMNPNGGNEQRVAGNFYSKGNLTIPANSNNTFNNTFEIEGNVSVERNVTINAKTKIDGDLRVGGKLTVAQPLTVTGTIYCDEIVGYDGTNTSSLVPGSDPTKTVFGHYVVNTAEGYTMTEETALYNANAWYQENQWYGYNTPAWTRTDGTILEKLQNALLEEVQDDSTVLYYKEEWINGTLTKTYIDPPVYRIYKDENGAEVSEAEAAIWVDTQYYAADGTPLAAPVIFPEEYEKQYILGQEELPGHDTTDDSKIITTVNDVLTSNNNPYNTLHEIPDDYKNDVAYNVITFTKGGSNTGISYDYTGTVPDGQEEPSSDTVYTTSGDQIIITKSCTISGEIFKNKLVFKVPTGEEIWVKVDGLKSSSSDEKIIHDDSDPNFRGTVNLLLTDDLRFEGNNNRCIVTSTLDSLLSSNQQFQLYTDESLKAKDNDGNPLPTQLNDDGSKPVGYCPTIHGVNFNIYADTEEHQLYLKNSALLTANIKAPYLTIEIASGGGNAPSNSHIYYNGYDVMSDNNAKNLGCIGCCIISEFSSQNNWTLLYVGKGAGSGSDGFDDALMKSWSILYYENY